MKILLTFFYLTFLKELTLSTPNQSPLDETIDGHSYLLLFEVIIPKLDILPGSLLCMTFIIDKMPQLMNTISQVDYISRQLRVRSRDIKRFLGPVYF